MAKKTYVRLIDDLDGSEAAETVNFSLDGVTYEVDLSESNASRLRETAAPYVNVAQRTGGRRQRGGATHATGDNTQQIREWAKSNGYEIADRGRVSQTIRAAYQAAHAG